MRSDILHRMYIYTKIHLLSLLVVAISSSSGPGLHAMNVDNNANNDARYRLNFNTFFSEIKYYRDF